MAFSISSMPSIDAPTRPEFTLQSTEMYSMAPAQLQTNIRHSRVWLWCRAKVPINSKSESLGFCGYVDGNLTVSLSSERSTDAGSAYPLIVTDGSGHFYTSPRVYAHHRSEGEFSIALQGMKLLQKNVSKSQQEPQHPKLFSKHRCLKAQYGRCRVKTLHCSKCQFFTTIGKQPS